MQSLRSVVVLDKDSFKTSRGLQTLFPVTALKVAVKLLLLFGVFAIDKRKTRKKLAKRGCDRISLDPLVMLADVVTVFAGDGRRYIFQF